MRIGNCQQAVHDHVHVDVDVDGFGRIRPRSGPFEEPAPGKSPALPEYRYSRFTIPEELAGGRSPPIVNRESGIGNRELRIVDFVFHGPGIIVCPAVPDVL